MPARRLLLVLLLPLLQGCEQMAELLELPNPQKEAEAAEAEGRAIGGACRHAGRALEDCYTLNPKALKSAVFAGWREMNDYMMANNIAEVPAQLTPPAVITVVPAEADHAPGIIPGQPFTPIQPPR